MRKKNQHINCPAKSFFKHNAIQKQKLLYVKLKLKPFISVFFLKKKIFLFAFYFAMFEILQSVKVICISKSFLIVSEAIQRYIICFDDSSQYKSQFKEMILWNFACIKTNSKVKKKKPMAFINKMVYWDTYMFSKIKTNVDISKQNTL